MTRERTCATKWTLQWREKSCGLGEGEGGSVAAAGTDGMTYFLKMSDTVNPSCCELRTVMCQNIVLVELEAEQRKEMQAFESRFLFHAPWWLEQKDQRMPRRVGITG